MLDHPDAVVPFSFYPLQDHLHDANFGWITEVPVVEPELYDDRVHQRHHLT